MQRFEILVLMLLVLSNISCAYARNVQMRNNENRNTVENRLTLDPDKAPFYHGVASGDPLEDAVIIWTRVTPYNNNGSLINDNITVGWEMSTDKAMNTSELYLSGLVQTNSSIDNTVKVDVKGLIPDTVYYYRFQYFTNNTKALFVESALGRTKTAPTQSSTSRQLRFATVSCSNLQSGYFNPYDRISERIENDIDAVIHLGDYIYEYGPGTYGQVRDHEPPYEMITLNDYRTRYAQYRLDPSLQNIHQSYPFITTWDDHEFANNAYMDGAENHQPLTEGEWKSRRENAAKVYSEWMPIRLPIPSKPIQIYRTLRYGNIADIFVLDTRIIGREKQVSIIDGLSANTSLLGEDQGQWLQDELLTSNATWKIIAQQVMVGPLEIACFLPLNMDQWDGYNNERQRLFNFISENNIKDIIFLTGDLHSSWALNKPLENGLFSGRRSVGVEFVTTSVSSPSFDPDSTFFTTLLTTLTKLNNRHIEFMQLTKRGYGILDLTMERAQNDFYFTGPENSINSEQSYGVSYYTNKGENKLQKSNEPSSRLHSYGNTTNKSSYSATLLQERSIKSWYQSVVLITGIYPNLKRDQNRNYFLELQYFLYEKSNDMHIEIYDIQNDTIIHKEDLGARESGIHLRQITINTITLTGDYSLKMFRHDQSITDSIFRIP